jgi:hypothetical protein
MHILGMAKSSLTLKGAKASKLELDFFKLAFAVSVLRTSGEQAIGYLQVLAAPVRDRAIGWTVKYSTGDAVTVLYVSPTKTELAHLAAEKARNALGLISLPDAEHADKTLSLASSGEEFGESALVREVIARHPSVVRITDPQRFPQRIDWDFYGTV